jgi:RNA polymerase-binding protein DksA
VAKKDVKTERNKTAQKRRRKTGLSQSEIEHFRQLLLSKRREIFVNFHEMEDETMHKSRQDAAGDLSCMPIHMADIGTDNFEQEFSLNLMDSERKLLHEIDNALARIEQGSYGKCTATGKAIRKARLEAQPWAKYSVEFARMLEQGLASEPQEKKEAG